MPRAKAKVDNFTFVKGLITEAGPLTFPENASLDEDNFVLNRNGSRQVRKGIDYEPGYNYVATGISESSLGYSPPSYDLWYIPGEDVTQIGIIRILNKLWFVDAGRSNASANLLNGGQPITITGLTTSRISTAQINGKFILVSPDLDKIQELSYDRLNDRIVITEHELLTRDVWGISEPLKVDERSSTLTHIHRYNLQNQGWDPAIVHTCASGNAIECTKTNISVYPSSADIWSYGKIANAGSADFNKYSPTDLKRNSIGNTPAPKGRFVISVYNRGASRVSNILTDNTREATSSSQWFPTTFITDESPTTGTYYRNRINTEVINFPADIENGRVSCVTSFAGRLFYSGIESRVTSGDKESPDLSGYIFFSPTIISNEHIGHCYPEADPTSDKISDVVDSDGGLIYIPEAIGIKALISVGNSLIVFASNGIWEVYGADDIFTATSFAIGKVSNIGTDNLDSIVLASDSIVFWAQSGIYICSRDSASGRMQLQNLSLNTIQTYYNSLSSVTKKFATGAYEEKEQRIRWMFNDSVEYTINGVLDKYNKELVFDLALQSFNPLSFSVPTSISVKIVDYVKPANSISEKVEEVVLVNGASVQINGEGVNQETSLNSTEIIITKFLILKIISGEVFFTFGAYNNSLFYDWVTELGISAEGSYHAYLVTGYTIMGDGSRNKQVPYLVMFFRQTETGYNASMEFINPSSCFVQPQWQWTNSAESNKWGTKFQAYRLRQLYTPADNGAFNDGDSVVTTKNKLRGNGKSLSLLIESEPGKDLQLLGWTMDMVMNANI